MFDVNKNKNKSNWIDHGHMTHTHASMDEEGESGQKIKVVK